MTFVFAPGWGGRAWSAFSPGQSHSERGEIVGFGDSTLYGSGADYSLIQRVRDDAVGDGYADGGKGFFAGGEYEIVYDAPEINGWSLTNDIAGTGNGFIDSTDGYDALGGGFLFDDGSPANANRVLSFHGTCFRLWYSKRAAAGKFRYRVDSGSWTTIDAYMTGEPVSTFEYVSGLTLDDHTVEIENLATTTQDAGTKGCWIGFAGMSDDGFTTQKFALSGQTFSTFNSTWRYWAALGLTYNGGSKDDPASYAIDTSIPSGGRVNPVLVMLELGFNDLSGPTSAADEAEAGIRNLDAALQVAGADLIVLSGQLPYNDNWVARGAEMFNRIKDTAYDVGAAWVDLFFPVGGASLAYSGGPSNPHLTKPEYVAQADYLWDGLPDAPGTGGIVATKSAETIAA